MRAFLSATIKVLFGGVTFALMAVHIAHAGALIVPQGGTGIGTCTDGGVMVGNGTGPVYCTAVGSSGQVLTSNGSGKPTWQTPAAGFSTSSADAWFLFKT